MATKTRTVYRCTECGADHAKWAGRCDACGEWNTLVEEVQARAAGKRPSASSDRGAAAVQKLCAAGKRHLAQDQGVTAKLCEKRLPGVHRTRNATDR